MGLRDTVLGAAMAIGVGMAVTKPSAMEAENKVSKEITDQIYELASQKGHENLAMFKMACSMSVNDCQKAMKLIFIMEQQDYFFLRKVLVKADNRLISTCWVTVKAFCSQSLFGN